MKQDSFHTFDKVETVFFILVAANLLLARLLGGSSPYAKEPKSRSTKPSLVLVNGLCKGDESRCYPHVFCHLMGIFVFFVSNQFPMCL